MACRFECPAEQNLNSPNFCTVSKFLLTVLFFYSKYVRFFRTGNHWKLFRQFTFIVNFSLVKLALRKEKRRFPEESDFIFPGKHQKERTIMSSKNNNQLNIPQAREAMDKFKMQAASEVGVNLTNG